MTYHAEDAEPDAPLDGGYYDSDEVPSERPKRSGVVCELDEYVAADIVEHLSRGAYFHVAVEAAGADLDHAKKWLAMGRLANAIEPYRSFAARVMRAKAGARVEAESRVWIAKPQVWLRQGPGRDRGKAGRPGWTNAVKVTGELTHSGAIGHMVATIDASRLTDAELIQLESLTARALPEQGSRPTDESPTTDTE